jgi:CrtC N-terminal lipocalin domain
MTSAADDVSSNPFPWQWPIPAPGPSWNVPQISLPGCLGLLLQYQNEWWYYAGHAYDTDGVQYSLQFSINRMGFSDSADLQLIACMAGIGDSSDNSYLFETSFSWGVSQDAGSPRGLTVPPVTNGSYDVSTHPLPLLGTAATRVFRTGGVTGMKGSQYRLSSSTAAPATYTVELDLIDERGMVLEWQSGYIGPDSPAAFGNESFEFAQPRLRIAGGTLLLQGRQRTIKDGTIWLDRQVLTSPPAQSRAAVPDIADISNAVATSGVVQSLYRGSWMGITLDNGLTLLCACFWQEPKPPLLQWQTGTLLGLPPLAAYGNLYLNEAGRRVRNGGTYLRGLELGDPDPNVFDFDVNILQPDQPDTSPHWKSPGSTYSNGWWIRIGTDGQRYGLPPNLYLKAIVSGCENVLPSTSLRLNAYWEGAANVYSDPGLTQQIGHAFVEQMGFN